MKSVIFHFVFQIKYQAQAVNDNRDAGDVTWNIEYHL